MSPEPPATGMGIPPIHESSVQTDGRELGVFASVAVVLGLSALGLVSLFGVLLVEDTLADQDSVYDPPTTLDPRTWLNGLPSGVIVIGLSVTGGLALLWWLRRYQRGHR